MEISSLQDAADFLYAGGDPTEWDISEFWEGIGVDTDVIRTVALAASLALSVDAHHALILMSVGARFGLNAQPAI